MQKQAGLEHHLKDNAETLSSSLFFLCHIVFCAFTLHVRVGDWQTLAAKGQTVNMFSLAGHIYPHWITTTWFCSWSPEVVPGIMDTNGYCYAPNRLYSQTLIAEFQFVLLCHTTLSSFLIVSLFMNVKAILSLQGCIETGSTQDLAHRPSFADLYIKVM